jgi:hypothetical protein
MSRPFIRRWNSMGASASSGAQTPYVIHWTSW